MTEELKADLRSVMERAHQRGIYEGITMGKSLEQARRRDNIVFAFIMGAMLGLLAGVSL